MTIFVQSKVDGSFSVESRLVYQFCVMDRRRVKCFKPNQMLYGTIDLDGAELVVGSVECVTSAFQQLNLPTPTPNYYPTELSSYLYRKVWSTTVKEVISRVACEQAVFAKSVNWKESTGRVYGPS